MKIAIVGSKDSVEKVYAIAKEVYTDYEFIHFEVDNTDDCKEVLAICEEKSDGIIFTGLGFVKIISEFEKFSKPYEIISRDGTSIMKAFWNIKKMGLNPKNIGIDVVDESLVKDICTEFDLKFNEIFVSPYNPQKKEIMYREEYKKLWDKGKIDLVITSYGWLYNELKKQDIKVIRLEITNPLIRNSIDSIINKIQKTAIKKSQIAIQIVDISVKQDSNRYQYDVLKKIIFVESKLIDYIALIQGTMFKSGYSQFTIVSTRGAIENQFAKDNFINILKEIEKENIQLSSGVGFGNTVYDADFNSRTALNSSKEFHESAYFIVDDEKNIIGPISNDKTFYYKSLIIDENINNIAKQSGISTTYLSKIHYLLKNTNTEYLDSKTLAELLCVTERSASRILKKLLDIGYAEIVTSTQINTVGRPKNIFKINIPL